MNPYSGLAWIADHAGLINETVRNLEAIEYFRQVVRQWYQEYRVAGDALDEWRRRRDTHGRRIESESTLQSKSPIPPEVEKSHEYWIFTELLYETDPVEELVGRLKCATGWVPVELLHEPCADLPLPVPDRVLTMPERYAVSAVIHDAVLPFDSINPWQDEPPWWEHEDKKHIPGFTYAVLKLRVRDLRDEHRLAIKTIVESTLVDLKRVVEREREAKEPTGETEAVSNHVDKVGRQSHGPSGMDRTRDQKRSIPRRDLTKRAETYVKRHGYPGHNSLARALGCPASSLVNAVNESTYLKARKAEFEADREGKPREAPLSDLHIDSLEQFREYAPDGALDELIAEQEVEMKSDERHPRKRRTSGRS